jgi:hypothetical protein
VGDLKEDGIINVQLIPTKCNSSESFAKNFDGPFFEKHTAVYCRQEYMQYLELWGEGTTKCLRDQCQEQD